MVYEFCANIAANGFANWGLCLSEAFWGDAVLTTLGVLGILAFIGYKMNFPHEVSVTLGVGIIFMMTLFAGATMYPFFALTIILVAVYIVRGLLKPAKR